MNTNSPIGDAEQTTQMQEPIELKDPVGDQTVEFRSNKKYGHILGKFQDRQESLRQEVRAKNENETYQEYGIRCEVNQRLIQEIDNFLTDIELTYGLRKQQR